jgi:hypothetical protein
MALIQQVVEDAPLARFRCATGQALPVPAASPAHARVPSRDRVYLRHAVHTRALQPTLAHHTGSPGERMAWRARLCLEEKHGWRTTLPYPSL